MLPALGYGKHLNWSMGPCSLFARDPPSEILGGQVRTHLCKLWLLSNIASGALGQLRP